MRALQRRPTTLERWPKGVHPGIVLSTRDRGGGDAFYQKRVPKGAPDYVQTARIQFPSGRTADEVCPTETGRRRLGGADGDDHLSPLAGAPRRRRPSRRAAHRPRSPAGDRFRRRRAASPVEARELLGELGYAGFPKTSGGRGMHLYIRIEPRWTFTDVRHAAIAFGRELERRLPEQVTTKWWKEERGERIFIDYNQNARDRTIASAYSIRPKPGAPVSAPLTLGRACRRRARGVHGGHDAGALRAARRPARRHRRASPTRSSRCLTMYERDDEPEGLRRHALSRRITRRCRASPSGCSPRATGTGHAAAISGPEAA